MKTSTINSVEITNEKERKKRKIFFKTNVLVPKTTVVRKEEGATAAATYLLSGETVPAGLVRAERAAILHGDSILWESPIKYHKCPTFDTKRTIVQTNVQTNAGNF